MILQFDVTYSAPHFSRSCGGYVAEVVVGLPHGCSAMYSERLATAAEAIADLAGLLQRRFPDHDAIVLDRIR